MKCSYYQLFRLVLFGFVILGVSSFSVNKAEARVSVQHHYGKILRIRTCTGSFRSKPSCVFQDSSIIRQNMMPHEIGSSSVWTAVEYFDGSTIVDPVVVSNVFWTRLQSNILSFVLGQFLAAVVFTILLSVARSQLSKLSSFVAERIFSSSSSTSGRQQLNAPLNLRDGYLGTIQPDFGKLLLCLAIDAIGSSSTLIPILGDASDVLWAPLAGLLLRSLFNGSNVVFALEFTEEILPLTDILPLATICWVIDTFFQDSSAASLLQLGRYGLSSDSRVGRSDAIDIDPIETTSIRAKDVGSISDETKD